MNTKLTIKNFRVFDENGVTLDLAPITILTGCNSSGKSSIVKAVMLLDSFLKQVKEDIKNKKPIKLKEYRIDFSSFPFNLMGNFDNVVNTGSSSKQITIEYDIKSLMLSKDITVKIVFNADENGDSTGAYIERLSMRTKEGEFFSSNTYKNNNIRSIFNCNLIKKDFINFLLKVWEYYENKNGIAQPGIESEIENILKSSYNFFTTTTYKYVDSELIKWSKEHGSLFKIPIIDILDNVSRENLYSFIINNIINHKDNDKGNTMLHLDYYNNDDESKILLVATRKVVNDFLSSGAESFSQYFHMYENNYFTQQKMYSSILPVDLDEIGCIIDFEEQHSVPQYTYGFEGDFLNSYIDSVLYNYENYEINSGTGLKKAVEYIENDDVNFRIIYTIVMRWNAELDDERTQLCKYIENIHIPEDGSTYIQHKMIRLISGFERMLLRELITPEWSGNIDYISSSRAIVNRQYALDSDIDFALLIKKYLSLQSNLNESLYFINKWIKNFEIGYSVSVHKKNKGADGELRLHYSNKDEGRLLADEGYGITQLVYILLQIGIVISEMNENKNSNKDKICTIAIEEPEIHLHPKIQSRLADMFLEAYEKYNIHFIIETHSEYLIRKSQVLVSKMGFESNIDSDAKSPFRTYYVPRDGEPYSLGYRKDGKFAESFGPGFYDEAANLTFEIM